MDDWDTGDSGNDDGLMGANVAKLRKDLGLSQAQVAEAMREAGLGHWHQNTVSRVENGRQGLKVGEIIRLQKILGLGIINGTKMADQLSLVAEAATEGMIRARLQTLEDSLEAIEEWVSGSREALTELRGLLNRGEHPEAE